MRIRSSSLACLGALWICLGAGGVAAGDPVEIILQSEATNPGELFAARVDEVHVRAAAGSSSRTTL